MVHAAPHGTDIDLTPLRDILVQDFNPTSYQDALELILGACQEAQHLYGYVPPEAAQLIADHLGVTINRVFGLLTFYADFRTEPPGKHFMLLCHGTACYVMGSQKLVDDLQSRHGIRDGGTTSDGEFSLQVVNGCLGVCDLAPVIQFDHHTYCGHLTVDQLNQVMDGVRAGRTPEDMCDVEKSN